MKTISTQNAPAAIGPYSQAVDCGDYVFLSGMIPVDPKTNALVQGDIAAQANQVFQNMQAVLQAAGLSIKNVVKTTVFLRDLSHFAAVNEIYAAFFSEPYPARSCIEAAKLPKDALIECEAVAKR